MSNATHNAALVAALAVARVRAWRTGLLALHKTLIDAERARYERIYGPISSAHEALRLVLHDPWFAWLRPMADRIVQIDERLASPEPISPAEVATIRGHITALLHVDRAPESFRVEYRRALQDWPEVVVTHGQLMALLADDRS
ncbi:MAG: hypothetical protein ABI051_12965 [Vicinamibacterales bacterium]